MKYLYYLFTILYALNLTYSQTTEENELRFLTNKRKPNLIIYNIITYNGNCVSGNTWGSSLTKQRCGFSQNLTWRFIETWDFSGSYYIQNSNDLVIDNDNEKQVNGNPVIGYSLKQMIHQLWHIESADDKTYFMLRLYRTKYCLDNGNSPKVGTSFIIWECDKNNKNQWFTRQKSYPQSDKFYNIVTNKGFCISLKSGKLSTHRCGNSSDLLWKFNQNENEFKIQDKDGLAMDNSEANLADGNNIESFNRDIKPEINSNWNIETVNNGFYFRLRVVKTEFCLDNEKSDKLGTNIIFRLCNSNNKNQWFYLMISN